MFSGTIEIPLLGGAIDIQSIANQISNTTRSMTNSIVPSNFVRFDSEGLELVVDTTTGKAYASISATARMLEIDASNLAKHIKNPLVNYPTLDAEIPTTQGLRSSVLLSSNSIFKLALKYHPQLAEAMGDAGANVYMLGLAGYKVQIEQPNLPTDELGWMELAVAKKKEALSLAAQIEADRPATELGKAIGKSDNNIRIGDFAKAIGMGQNKYFDELRECKIIMATGTLPYQRFLNDGYFVVTEAIVNNKAYPVSLITPKGQAYLVKRHQQHLKSVSIECQVESSLMAIV
jgi:phage antirepressor YoqD-like protein